MALRIKNQVICWKYRLYTRTYFGSNVEKEIEKCNTMNKTSGHLKCYFNYSHTLRSLHFFYVVFSVGTTVGQGLDSFLQSPIESVFFCLSSRVYIQSTNQIKQAWGTSWGIWKPEKGIVYAVHFLQVNWNNDIKECLVGVLIYQGFKKFTMQTCLSLYHLILVQMESIPVMEVD